MVRTRMPGGVGGKAREGYPIPILFTKPSNLIPHVSNKLFVFFCALNNWHDPFYRQRLYKLK